MESCHGEWSQLDPLDLEIALECGNRSSAELGCAHREEPSHGLVPESAQRELDRRRRRAVEPLKIVDRTHDLRLAGERAQKCEQPGTDDATLGGSRGCGAEKRGVEADPLRLRESREQLVGNVGQQIREPREPKSRFRLGRPGDQQSRPLRAGLLDPGLPQRRLPDSGLAHDRDHTGPPRAQEGLDSPQLRFAPYEARHA